MDPMCGSGTFLIEAALMAANQAPGLSRGVWPFETWPDFDELLWADVRAAAVAARADPPPRVTLVRTSSIIYQLSAIYHHHPKRPPLSAPTASPPRVPMCGIIGIGAGRLTGVKR